MEFSICFNYMLLFPSKVTIHSQFWYSFNYIINHSMIIHYFLILTHDLIWGRRTSTIPPLSVKWSTKSSADQISVIGFVIKACPQVAFSLCTTLRLCLDFSFFLKRNQSELLCKKFWVLHARKSIPFIQLSYVWGKEIICHHGSFIGFLTKCQKDNAVG